MMYQFRYLEGILYNNRGILYMEEKSAGSNSYHAYREYIESFNRYFPYSLKDYENEIYNISLVYIRRIEELKENPRAYVYSLELGMSYLNHSYLLRKQTSLGIYLAFYYHQCFHACIALNNLFRDKEVDQILYDEEVELIDKYHSVWESDEYFKDDKIRIDTPLYMEGQKLYTIYDILIDWFNVDKETLKQWSKQTFQEKLLFKCIAFLDEVKSHSITEQVIYDENQVLIETEIPKISSKRQLSLGYCDSGITYRKIVQYYKANKKDYSEFLIKGEVDFKRAISISNTLSINTTLKKAYKEFPALYECSDNIQKAIDICQQGIDANIDEKLTTTLKEKKGKLK